MSAPSTSCSNSSVSPASAPCSPTQLVALAAITFISGWKGAPFLVIALIAALKSIPDELYEAAEVDGAGAFSRFWHVTLPSIWNTMVIVALILGILAFYSFDLAWIMTKGGPQDGTAIVGIQIYRAVFLDLRPAYAAAISVVMLGILFLSSLARSPPAEDQLMRAASPAQRLCSRRRHRGGDAPYADADPLGVPRLNQARAGHHVGKPLADAADLRPLRRHLEQGGFSHRPPQQPDRRGRRRHCHDAAGGARRLFA